MKQRSTTTSGNGLHLGTWLGGAALGALTMYFTDPEQGRRRRALTRDKLNSAVVQSNHAVSTAARDLGNRLQGLKARGTRLIRTRTAPQPDDPVLAARIRTRLGRVTAHSHPLAVEVHDGCVHLSGPVLASEKAAILGTVRAMRGVREVTEALSVHESAQGVPALQGGEERHMSKVQGTWPPGLRALAGAGAGAMALYALRRRGAAGTLMGTAGLGLLARSLANRPLLTSTHEARHPGKTAHNTLTEATRETAPWDTPSEANTQAQAATP